MGIGIKIFNTPQYNIHNDTIAKSVLPIYTKANSDYPTDIDANGKIDKPFYQGEIGDCVLMATLRTVGDNEEISNDLARNIIPDGKQGYFINILHDENELIKINVTKDEILKAKELGIYSSGDDDVLIIELAYEKYLRQTNPALRNACTEEVLDGNNISTHNLLRELTNNPKYKYFTRPNQHEITYTPDDITKIIDKLENSKDKYSAWVGFKSTFVYPRNGNPIYFAEKPEFVKTDITGAMGYMASGQHAFSFRRIEILGDEKYVVLTNNQKSAMNREVKLPYEIFINLVKEFAVYGENVNEFEEIYNAAKTRESINDGTIDNDYLVNVAENKLNKELLRVAKGITADLKNSLKTANRSERIALVKQYADYLKTVAPEELMIILCSNEVESLIKVLDKMEYGWGNGKAKKDLIMPIVEVAYELYVTKNINIADIAENEYQDNEIREYAEQIKDICVKELDAKFYTNENKIIEAVRKLACETCNCSCNVSETSN